MAGGKTLRASNVAWLILLGVLPLYAIGGSQGVLGREEVGGRGFLRNEGGRSLQDVDAGECGVDFAGVRSSGGTGKVCCVEECGTCGGDGCDEFADELGFEKEHCCVNTIKATGVMCSDTAEAPCVIEVTAECGVDFPGVRSSGGTGKICCAEGCGMCGGDDCGDCCTAPILQSGVMCSDTSEAPCIIESMDLEVSDTTDYVFIRCSELELEDVEGEDSFFIKVMGGHFQHSDCYEECASHSALYFGLWGDDFVWCGCGGSVDFLEAKNKTEGECDITCPGNDGETCGGAVSYNLYEILESFDVSPTPSPVVSTCSGGIVGVESESGDVCCPAGCSACGAPKCVGNGDCCPHTIQEKEGMCSDTNEAPCIFNKVDGTPAPAQDSTPAPVPAGTPAPAQSVDNYDFVRCSLVETEDYDQLAFSFTGVGGNVDLANCYEECTKKDALYFAVWGDAHVCGCGNSLAFLEATNKPTGDCNIACPADNTVTCGGPESYDLYKILQSASDDDVDTTTDSPTCSSGIVGVESESGDVCCEEACGTCGEPKCVGNGDCCPHTIQSREGLCSETNAAPCIYNRVDVETPAPAPVPQPSPQEVRQCSNGLPGVESEDGATCCSDGCDACEGGTEEDCTAASQCCPQAVHTAGVFCSDDGVSEGPCIIY